MLAETLRGALDDTRKSFLCSIAILPFALLQIYIKYDIFPIEEYVRYVVSNEVVSSRGTRGNGVTTELKVERDLSGISCSRCQLKIVPQSSRRWSIYGNMVS